MQYTYNGEIKCNKEDSEKVLAYIREIFPFPDIVEDGEHMLILISDETRGDITDEISEFCSALKREGISVSGKISYTGDYDGRYVISGNEYEELSAEQCVIRDAPIQDLIDELKRRHRLNGEKDKCHLEIEKFFDDIHWEKELVYACEDAIQIASDEDIEIDEGDEEYLAKQFLDNHDCNVADNDRWIAILKDYEEEKHNKFYFTFGSDPGFPYQNTYLIVEAVIESSAIRKFRKKFPDRHENTFNAAFCYSQEKWERYGCEKHYPDGPAEVIR